MDDANRPPSGHASGHDEPIDPVLQRFERTARRLPSYLRLAAELSLDGRVPVQAKVAVAVGGVYVLSPIDLVPGIVPVAGQLDDVVVLLLALREAVRTCPPPLAEEHLTRAGLSQTDFDDDLATCRDAVRWLARRGLRAGVQLAEQVGRRLIAKLQSA